MKKLEKRKIQTQKTKLHLLVASKALAAKINPEISVDFARIAKITRVLCLIL